MKPAYSRRLGSTEQALWLRDRATPLHFVLTAQVKGELQSTALTQALARLQQRHPLLRVSIALDSKNHAWFIEHPFPIPCRILQRQGGQHWQEVAARELQRPFVWSEAPLIRVVLLHSSHLSELLVICHHAIADGLATANLIQELLTLLSDPEQDMPARPIPPPLEALLSDYQPAQKILKLLARGLLYLKQFIQTLKRDLGKILMFDSLQVSGETLSTEFTTTLIHRCRAEGTTVHAAICTAVIFAIALHQKSLEQPLKCFSPINVRPYLQSSLEQDCGTYIAPALTTHSIDTESQFWQTARSLKSELTAQTESNHLLKLAQQHELLMGAKPAPRLLQQIFLERCESDVMVTNLGRLAISQQFGNLRLEAIYGPVVLSGFAQERVFGIATLDDRLSFTLTHQAPDSDFLLQQALCLLEHAIEIPELNLSTAASLKSQLTTQRQLTHYGRV
ncbi:MAG: condensation domain-containing protein [Kovacikia sp.]